MPFLRGLAVYQENECFIAKKLKQKTEKRKNLEKQQSEQRVKSRQDGLRQIQKLFLSHFALKFKMQLNIF